MSGFSSEDSNICRVTCWIRIFEDIRIASKWKSMMPIKVYRLRPNIILIALFWSLPMSMGMSCVEANFFPNSWQKIKSIRLKSVGIFLGGANNDDKFFKSIMIGEEIWVYGYGVENQNSRIPSTKSKKPIVFIILRFWDKCLKEETLTLAQRWIDFCTENEMTVLPEPPYTPDLALPLFLFPKVKSPIIERRFCIIEEIQQTSLKEQQKFWNTRFPHASSAVGTRQGGSTFEGDKVE